MNYRTLGKTNLKISEIGMGTWQLANDPNMWVGSDLSESLRSLHEFVEKGGNFIDTAWIYGWDDKQPDRHPSEELIGKFLQETGKRDELILATKIPGKNLTWPALRNVPVSEVFPPEHIRQCVEDSLRCLNVDSIDLVQFHVWQDDFVNDDGWKNMIQRLTKEGKVKFWGISANDYQPSNCVRALDTGLISTVQFIFNIFHQKPTETLLPYAKEHNIGLIARVPLDEGGLSGTISPDTHFAEGDFRGYYFSPERKKELLKRTNELEKLLGDEVQTLPELALKYILSFDEISTTIPGMRKVKNVDANTAVSDGRKLSSELMEELKKYSWERNFYPFVDPALKETGYLPE